MMWPAGMTCWVTRAYTLTSHPRNIIIVLPALPILTITAHTTPHSAVSIGPNVSCLVAAGTAVLHLDQFCPASSVAEPVQKHFCVDLTKGGRPNSKTDKYGTLEGDFGRRVHLPVIRSAHIRHRRPAAAVEATAAVM